ncbi:hypothetical protein M5K25_026606 [Dendrobium thyrsiflorum]|uniref:Uncharacterized protein n=1 Tax=Dendrobium thyrsiflorum TaxID=117978 RepID=A0ABD0TXX2_DENTH
MSEILYQQMAELCKMSSKTEKVKYLQKSDEVAGEINSSFRCKDVHLVSNAGVIAVIGLPLFGLFKEDSFGLPTCTGDGFKWDPIPSKLLDVSALFFEDQVLFVEGLKEEEILGTISVDAKEFMCTHLVAELELFKVIFMENWCSSLSNYFSAKVKAGFLCKELKLFGSIEGLSLINGYMATGVYFLSSIEMWTAEVAWEVLEELFGWIGNDLKATLPITERSNPKAARDPGLKEKIIGISYGKEALLLTRDQVWI